MNKGYRMMKGLEWKGFIWFYHVLGQGKKMLNFH
jgi:hypothetical protein